MNTRNVVGGGLVIAFLAGGYLSGLFPKFGAGPGGGGQGAAEKGAGKVIPQAVASDEEPPADAPQVAADLAQDPRVLEVRLDGRKLEVVEHKATVEEYREVSIPVLVQLALKKEGNENGIRVRVRRLKSSRASVEESLKQALHDAGIADDAVEWGQTEQ